LDSVASLVYILRSCDHILPKFSGPLGVFILFIGSGIYYTQSQINDITADVKPVLNTALSAKSADPKKGKTRPIPTVEKKQRRTLVPNHPSEYGIVLKELPTNGTSGDWESYYAKEHDYNVAKDPKLLEAYKKFQKTPEEVQKILARYDRRIAKYKQDLQLNPNDEDAKDRLQTMIRTRAFAKVISDKFNEIPHQFRK